MAKTKAGHLITTEQPTTGRPLRLVTDCLTVLALLHVAGGPP